MKKRILIEAALLEFIAAAGCILVVDNWALGALLIVAGILPMVNEVVVVPDSL